MARTYQFPLDPSLVQNIKTKYYSKEAVKDLLTSCENPTLLDDLTTRYQNLYSEWQGYMAIAEGDILGEYSQKFKYDYGIDFINNLFTLTIDGPLDADIAVYLDDKSKELNKKANN